MDKYTKEYEPNCEQCEDTVKLIEQHAPTTDFSPVSYNEELSPDEVLTRYLTCPKCQAEYTLDEDDYLEDA